MAWQAEVGSGTDRATDYHDLLTKIVAFATSQHVSAVAVNAGGTGYVVGDTVDVNLAGGAQFLAAKFEVTTVSGGAVTGLRIISSGAYSTRAVSATISAGGTGYVVGDILEVQGGSSRCAAKFEVTTVSGGAVTGVSLFEDGGAYSSTPSNPAATEGVGPSTYAGGDDCTLTVTYSSAPATTGVATTATSGAGTGLTVDLTYTQTGFSVDGRNTNNKSHNSINNEKEVVLVGDASGKTNKPYLGFGTVTATSGVNTRYAIALYGLIAHNPLLGMASQVSIQGDPTSFGANRPYLSCDEDQLQEMDFWLSADDQRLCGVVNTNSGAAATDDGEYHHFYHGFMDSFATETENPYPYMVGGSSRVVNTDPSSASTNVTGLSECLAPSGEQTGIRFWRNEDSTWRSVINTESTATTSRENVMLPVARVHRISGLNDLDYIVEEGPVVFWQGIGTMDRGSPTRRLRPIPGTVDHHFPIPLTVVQRPGDTDIDQTLDMPKGQLRGCFWIYNTDDTGATITNFSESYVEIGSDRYRVFHTQVHNNLYHFICMKEDV